MSRKGLHINVYTDELYRGTRLRTGSNDGSVIHTFGHYNTITLVGKGVPEIFLADEKYPACELITRMIGGKRILTIQPIKDLWPKGYVGPMSGGAFVSTTDSRFSEYTGIYAAISLHDRFETQEMYNLLSN